MNQSLYKVASKCGLKKGRKMQEKEGSIYSFVEMYLAHGQKNPLKFSWDT